ARREGLCDRGHQGGGGARTGGRARGQDPRGPQRARVAQTSAASAIRHSTRDRRTTMASMTMTIETVRAFNGLDVLVARDEGLFAAEGLDLRITSLPPTLTRSTADGTLSRPVTNQGRLVDRGDALMFQG